MRVLTVGNMYPPHHLGGYELVWRSAVDHLRRRGDEVLVLTTDTVTDPDAAGEDDPAVERTLRWYWRDHAFPPTSWREARAIERHNARTLDEHLAGRPDAVLWWSMGGLSVGLLGRPRRAAIPGGAVVHDAWPVYGPEVDGWARRRRRRGVPFARVDEWSFNSAFVRDAVLARRPEIDATRCRVDPPGVDADRLGAAPAGPWAGRLVCVGRIDDRKGVDVAVRAVAGLSGAATLDVVGGGDDAVLGSLQALAHDEGVEARVRFRGPVDDVAPVYAGADAVVFPVTWDEPFGLVPLEAMAAGRPVVATGTGGSAEYLEHGVNALVVRPSDPDAIAGAVRRLGSEPELRARLVEGGRRTAAARPARAFDEAIARFAADVAAHGGA